MVHSLPFRSIRLGKAESLARSANRSNCSSWQISINCWIVPVGQSRSARITTVTSLSEIPSAAGDKPIVHVDVDRLADLAVEFDHRAAAQLEQLIDLHGGAADSGVRSSHALTPAYHSLELSYIADLRVIIRINVINNHVMHQLPGLRSCQYVIGLSG